MPPLVFVPLSHDEAVELRSGVPLRQRRGCAVTPTLLLVLGRDTTTEEAEFAALSYAGTLALTVDSPGPRLVIAAEVEAASTTDSGSPFGEVAVTEVVWSQVRALFADEPGAETAVAAARVEAVGRPLQLGVDQPAVNALDEGWDLLWYATDELDRLV